MSQAREKQIQQAKLKILLAEIQARGLDVPQELLSKATGIQVSVPFPTDENGFYIKRDGTHYKTNNPNAMDFVRDKSRFAAYIAGRGSGKALAIDTPILTTSGWKSMETISVGDLVYSPNGQPVEVIMVSSIQTGHDCYRVSFDDGSWIIADADHEWVTHNHEYRKAIRQRVPDNQLTSSWVSHRLKLSPITTIELRSTLWHDEREHNHAIPVCSPLSFSDSDLPIHPYLLGVWLGDGSSHGNGFTIGDPEMLDILAKTCGVSLHGHCRKYLYSLDEHQSERNALGQYRRVPGSFVDCLVNFGIRNQKSIPDVYLTSSFADRLDLVRGLMDTDGTINKVGNCVFTNTNENIIRGFTFLLSSLGIKWQIRSKISKLGDVEHKRVYDVSFSTHISVFYLSKKASRQACSVGRPTSYYRYVVNVSPVDSVPVRCIVVASEDHLFLAGDRLIATHNSSSGAQKAVAKIAAGQPGAVLNPDFENFKISTWPEFREWIPWDQVIPHQRRMGESSWFPTQPFTLSFLNGSWVICKGLKDPDSARGPNINWLWFDEAGRGQDIKGESWQIAIASVRIGPNPQAWATGTPSGKEHWLHSFFIEQDIPDDALAAWSAVASDNQLISVFFSTIEENKDNLDPGFYASLLAAYPPGWFREQELHGAFVDRGSVLGDPKWFENHILDQPPDDIIRWIRFWDLAATERKMGYRGRSGNDPDETVGTLLGIRRNRHDFVIADQVSGELEWDGIERIILETAKRDGPLVKIKLEEEPGSGGKNQVAAIAKMLKTNLPGWYAATGQRPAGDKVMRANIWFSEASNGRFWLVRGKWNKPFLDQLGSFPVGRHDDKIDSVSGARLAIAPVRTWKSVSFLHV